MELDVTWTAIEERLLEIAERTDTSPRENSADSILVLLGLITVAEEHHDSYDDDGGEFVDVWTLTPLGEGYYDARFVARSPDETSDALANVLGSTAVVTAFCDALWGRGEVPVAGAVSLLRRLTYTSSEASCKRWLELMGKAGLISYNRSKPTVRVLYHPGELVPPDDEPEREQRRGHVLSPDTPFGNLLALRDLVRSARSFIHWYEQHMPPKVMEVLHREVDGANVDEIKLLSGPANLDDETKKDFKRFVKEMRSTRGIEVAWRVLSKKDAQQVHDRFFITNGQSKNLPPLNTIYAGSTGEILPSDVGDEEFQEWWAKGQDLSQWQPPPST